jgi:hypothetical protein
MGLLDEIRDEGRRVTKTERFLAQFSEEDRRDLVEALSDHSIPMPSIVRALHKRGVSVTLDQAYGLRRRLANESR